MFSQLFIITILLTIYACFYFNFYRSKFLAYFGEKANIVANHNIPKFLDDISKFSKSNKVNIIEMDLGTIKKQPSTKRVSLPETTEVSYVSSVNLMNSYMTKTPELHGICV